MAKLRLIGAVGIKVRPDTSGFRKEVEDQLRKIPDETKIKVKVEAKTTDAEKAIEKAKKEAEKETLQLKVGIHHDQLQAAKRQVQGLLKDLDTIRIPVKTDKAGLTAALAQIKELQKNANVEVHYNEDKAGYESVLAKIRQIQREKVEKTITFQTDDATLDAQAKKYQKLIESLTPPDPVKTITITHRNDHDSLATAVKQIDEALAKLQEKSIIVPSMDAAELMKTRNKLVADLAKKPIVMKMTEDKKGYEKVLARIQELQAEAAATKFQFETDDASLAKAAAEMQAKIEALTPKKTISFKYDNNTDSLRKALAEVESKLDEARKLEILADVDQIGLRQARDKILKALNSSEFQVSVSSKNLDDLEAQQKRVADMLKQYENKDVRLMVSNDEASLREAKQKLDDLVKERKAEIKAKPVTWEAMAELAYASRARVVPFYVRINQRSLAIAEGVLQSLAGINTLRESGKVLESMITKFDTFSLKVASISTLVGSITAATTWLVTGLLPVAEGVLDLAGLLAFAPAAMSAITAVALINIAAFQDFKEAIDGNAEALAKLPPQARATAIALQGAWEKIQQPVQNKFWEGMGDSMETAAKVLIPLFSKGLADAAEHAGRFGAGVFRAMEKISYGGGPLEQMLSNLSGFFDNAAGAAEPLTDAINTLGLRGSEFLPRFGTYLTDMATRFDEWITKADQAGDITRWMEQGVQSLKDLYTLGGGVTKMLQGLTTAAKAAGAGGLGVMADEFDRIGTMMKQEPFQSRLTTIFDGARAGASALNVGVKELGLTLGESSLWVANLLSQLGKLGGEVLVTISKGIANIDFQNGIMRGLSGMDSLVQQLQVGFYDLGGVVGNMSTIAGAAFTSIGPVINSIISLLDIVVGSLTDNIVAIIPNLMGMVGGLISALSGPVTVVTDLLNGVLGFINGLPAPLANLSVGLLTFLLLAGKIGPMFAAKPGGLLERITYDFQQADGARGKFQAGLKGLGAGLLGAVGGPWGIAIGVLTAGLAMAGAASAEAKSRIDEYTNSIDENTGALNANGLASAAKNLLDDGGFWNDRMRGAKKTQEAIDLLGLSFQETASIAARGGADYDSLIAKLDEFPGITGEGGKSMEAFAAAMGISETQASKLTKGDIVHLKSRLGEINSETSQGKANFDNMNDSMSRVPADAAAQKVADFNGAMEIFNDKTQTADNRVRALNRALDILNGRQPDVEAAQRSVNDAMRQGAGELQNINGVMTLTGGVWRNAQGAIKDFTGVIDPLSGKISTVGQAGSDLSRHLETVTGDVKTVATGMRDAKAPIGEISQYLADQRLAFVQQGEAAGLSADLVGAAWDYMIGAKPDVLLTTIMTEGADEAKAAIEAVKGSAEDIAAFKAVAKIEGDNTVLGLKLAEGYTSLEGFNKYIAQATLGLDPTQADAVRMRVLMDLVALAETNPTVLANMDPALLDEAKRRIDAELANLAAQRPSPEVDMKTEEAHSRLGRVMDLIGEVHRQKPQPVVDPQTDAANEKLGFTHAKAVTLGGLRPVPIVDTDNVSANNKLDGTMSKIRDVGNQKPNPHVNLTGTPAAGQALDILQGKLEPFNNKQYSFMVKANTDSESLQLLKSLKGANGGIVDGWGNALVAGLGLQKFANGGFHMGQVKQFANGGIENHVAQIARPSSVYRVWAEPETGGEAYIPLAASKRARSTAILDQVASQFGYKLTPAQTFADGGIVSGGNARNAGLQVHIDTFNQNANDTIEDVGRGIMRQVRNAGMAGIMDGI